jgi:hypothetical protein
MTITVSVIQPGSYFPSISGPYPAGVYTPESCGTQCKVIDPAVIGFNINGSGECYCLKTTDFVFTNNSSPFSTYLIYDCPTSPPSPNPPQPNNVIVNNSRGWKIATLVLGIILLFLIFYIKFFRKIF